MGNIYSRPGQTNIEERDRSGAGTAGQHAAAVSGFLQLLYLARQPGEGHRHPAAVAVQLVNISGALTDIAVGC